MTIPAKPKKCCDRIASKENDLQGVRLAIHPVDKLLEATASYLERYPQEKSLTVIADIGRMPYLPSFDRLMVSDPRVMSCLLVHERESDEGYVQSETLGYWGLKTSSWCLPVRMAQTVLLISSQRLSPSTLPDRFAQGGVQWVAYERLGQVSGQWRRRRFAPNSLRSSILRRLALAWSNLARASQKPLDLLADRLTGAGDDYHWVPSAVPIANGWRRALLLNAATHRRARRIETNLASPGPLAATTSAILRYVPDNDAPIVLVSASLEAGGAERQATITTAALHARGFSVRLAGSDTASPLAEHHYGPMLVRNGIPIDNVADETTEFADESEHLVMTEAEAIELITLQNRCRALPLGLGEITLQYYRYFRRTRPRLVHTWQDYSNTVAGLAALWAGVPRVVMGWRNVSAKHHALYQPFFRPFYKMILRDPRVVVVSNSKAGADDYLKWLGLQPKRLVITPNAFFDVFAKGGQLAPRRVRSQATSDRQSDNDRTVLGVFRFYPEKDPILFARTAGEIYRLRPDVVFKLIGQGRLEEALVAEAERAGLPRDRLVLLGRRTDALDFMAQADLLLHTAMFEGLPNVLIEAQAVGLPIVTTDAGGAREAVKPGVTAQVVHGRSPSTLARAVVACLEDEDWLRRARHDGPKHVAARFNIEPMLAATLSAYGLDEQASNGDAI